MIKHNFLFLFMLLFLTGCDDTKPKQGDLAQPEKADSISNTIHLDPRTSSYHVYAGGNIQEALESAAKDPMNKVIKVHEGTYQPAAHGQALIWFNARHDGITLEAVGEVILTAANADIADSKASSYPSVVNHVVYFGDDISRKTIFRGFKITGANNYVTGSGQISPIESNNSLRKGLFFYSDGGGIKVYGRSYPTIENVEVYDNYTSPCGAGASVEHLGHNDKSVLFKNCIFRNNRTQITGSAIDVLHGSWATIENCLFVGNISNTGVDWVGKLTGGFEYNKEHGSGALTVFPRSRATVINNTFTGNWAGVDDKGSGSTYINSIFWNNNLPGGISPGSRYELDVLDGTGVKGCFIHGDTNDLRGTISPLENTFDPMNPNFNADYIPQSPEYNGVGYRQLQ